MSLRSRMAIVVGLASAVVASVCAQAAPMQPVNGIDRPSMIIQVAGGCGPNGWRGPWGHCRSTPFYGRLPNGYYQPAPAAWNGCPEGYWRGPWGHCRNTPYHGRLPDGSWK